MARCYSADEAPVKVNTDRVDTRRCTYSTVYIAGALIVDWTAWADARARRPKKAVAKA